MRTLGPIGGLLCNYFMSEEFGPNCCSEDLPEASVPEDEGITPTRVASPLT